MRKRISEVLDSTRLKCVLLAQPNGEIQLTGLVKDSTPELVKVNAFLTNETQIVPCCRELASGGPPHKKLSRMARISHLTWR
jgi:hypothetical protein